MKGVFNMEKGNFFITATKREYKKQKQNFLIEKEGLIDNELRVGFVYDEDYKQFTATDLNTGLAILSGYDNTIDYFIDIFYNTTLNSLLAFRNSYAYKNMVRVFEILKEYGEPMTDRKINNILYKK